MATIPEIGTISILVVKMMMVIKQFVNCWRLTLLRIHYHLVVRGSAKRCKCGSLTEIFNYNNEIYCTAWEGSGQRAPH